MTKYILIGGHPDLAKDGGRSICEAAIEGLKPPVNILICMFAREIESWDELFDKKKQFFVKNLSDIRLNFTLADQANFLNQIVANDLLYINGGDTTELYNRLANCPGWTKKLAGKNVAGSSAGTDILSKYNFDVEKFKCANGLGLVPVKTIVHYGAEFYKPPIGWEAAYKELEKYKENLPIWNLAEGEFMSMTV